MIFTTEKHYSPRIIKKIQRIYIWSYTILYFFSSLIALGALVGGPLSATFVERFGRKMVLMFSNVPLCIGWFMIIYASDYMLLYAGRILTGISIGMISLAAPLYIAEIATKVWKIVMIYRYYQIIFRNENDR